ncbi:MAG: MlaD family protein [Candidatus Omnitrophota bacterium]
MQKEKYEFRVGLFVLIGIAILIFMVFSIGDIYISAPGYRIKAHFGFIGGLDIGAPVRLAGTKIGKVEKVRIVRDPKSKTCIELLLWVNKDTVVEKDAQFAINTLGMFGEKYVEITPGSANSAFLKDNEIVIGRDPVPMEQITFRLCELLDNISMGRGTIGKLLKDDEIYNDLRDFVKDIKAHPWKLFKAPRK